MEDELITTLIELDTDSKCKLVNKWLEVCRSNHNHMTFFIPVKKSRLHMIFLYSIAPGSFCLYIHIFSFLNLFVNSLAQLKLAILFSESG